jgi:pyruvate dehydrogenase E2 component (dihydrolipoamide acetyltransferase)
MLGEDKMATWEFKLPDLGEGVTEGEIVAWLVQPGDAVIDDQAVIEVMTDKATMTITSSRNGRVLETRGKVGDMVAVHSVLAVYEVAEGTSGSVADAHAPSIAPAAISVPVAPQGRGSGTIPVAPAPPHAAAAVLNANPLATPATRKLARELNIDLRTISGTGPQGRVTREDVLSSTAVLPGDREARGAVADANVQGSNTAMLPPPHAQAAAPLREPVRIAPTGSSLGGSDASTEDVRVPFAGMRRKIATKMSQSKNTAAHFTFVEECDVTKLRELRARLRPKAEQKGVKLTFLPFIVKAVVAALKRFPTLNSALDESTNEIVTRRRYHIGIAASTDSGLMVPVVKDADRRSILQTSIEIDRLAADAKTGKSKMEDLTGSTFTITSLGAQGGLFATPIINFPEVGILGVHQIKERPVVRDGQIVIGHVMLLSLSFDHRIVDGHVGAAFAYEIIRLLEDPDALLLEIG